MRKSIRCDVVGGATLTHLQLVIVRLAAAVSFLCHVFVGVKEEADATVVTHLHMLHTCTGTTTRALIKTFIKYSK